MSQKSKEKEAMKAAEETSSDPWVMAAVGSVVLSLYFFFLQRERKLGIFVGLWPPTFLAFGSYFEQTRMSNWFDRAMQ